MSSCVIAFSGGLDTSFLVPYAKEKYGFSSIITCTVNTGGFSPEDKSRISDRSKELGADKHVFIDAEQEFYDSVIKFMIFGNVTRDGYPLSVGSERLVQAKNVLAVAKEYGADAVMHGSTGAGNDQYRFDVAIQVLGKGRVSCLAPIREHSISRAFSTDYLKGRNLSIPSKNTNYSYNVGLWGVTIGGTETHTSTGLLPEDAWHSRPSSELKPLTVKIVFQNGEPIEASSSLGSASSPIEVIKFLAKLGSDYGIGRHYHVGTSIPGKKGRVAYESPAADILYEAHRTLEKLVLSQAQISGKRSLSDEYGRLMHEAKFFDPYLEDLKAFLVSSQRRVSGSVELVLRPYRIESAVADSPFNLLHVKGAMYGETSQAYDGRDAEGATKLHGFEQFIISTFND